MQTINVDRARKLVDVRLTGFLSPEDVAWTGEEVRAAIRTLGDDVGKHVTLYDVSEIQVAPAATVEALQRTFTNPTVRTMWARKVAFVTPSALTRLQVQRLREAREDIGIFENRAQAIEWLLD
ncbi:hypothetical protein [Sphingomonas sp. M1-B02]|uniref:hypothetical protein n=1 Tax=Sphingomonas sp. M1-B02 TaxID=3114300 RepID=UPI00223FE74C|nr:hypothetical protein [Sphingomonas sp. S6-11]UZK65676.1 hypothetical protein OKW87_14335 [Sphingomonas sp. S6-11]